MDNILKQFRRIYSDSGSKDVDFSAQEERLRLADNRLTQATQELTRAADRLNDAALGVDRKAKQLH
jgi:hypothetical protein